MNYSAAVAGPSVSPAAGQAAGQGQQRTWLAHQQAPGQPLAAPVQPQAPSVRQDAHTAELHSQQAASAVVGHQQPQQQGGTVQQGAVSHPALAGGRPPPEPATSHLPHLHQGLPARRQQQTGLAPAPVQQGMAQLRVGAPPFQASLTPAHMQHQIEALASRAQVWQPLLAAGGGRPDWAFSGQRGNSFGRTSSAGELTACPQRWGWHSRKTLCTAPILQAFWAAL